MSLVSDLQSPSVGKLIELFILDLTPLGGPVYHFSPTSQDDGSYIEFGGTIYTPLPITGDGWQKSIDGAAPQPNLKVSNITKYLQTTLSTYEDLVGAKVTRFQTLERFLDSGSTPDGNQTFNICVYIIQQKTKQNKYEIEFRLSSIIDQPMKKLPFEQVLRKEFPAVGLYRK